MAASDLKTDLKIHMLIRSIISKTAINRFLRSVTVTLKVVFQYACIAYPMCAEDRKG